MRFLQISPLTTNIIHLLEGLNRTEGKTNLADEHCTRGEICRNLKKFLFSLKFPVKTGKKVGVAIQPINESEQQILYIC